jgi:hypothetical protein
MRVDGVNEYIDPEYLPEGIQFEECHHLRSDDVEAILKHWIARKAAGKVPLIFKRVVKEVRRRKRTNKQQAVEDRSDSDETQPEQPDNPPTEDEEDPQHDSAGGRPQEGLPDQGSGDVSGRLSAVSAPTNMAIEDADLATLSSLTRIQKKTQILRMALPVAYLRKGLLTKAREMFPAGSPL